MVTPNGNDGSREWVEIVNLTAERLKLAGLRLYDCPGNNCGQTTEIQINEICELLPNSTTLGP